MKCVLCRHGETHPGKVTVTLLRGETAVIFKGVPAAVCENCGEYWNEPRLPSRAELKSRFCGSPHELNLC